MISLVPSLTEALAVSRRDVLVGATHWCTHPGDLDVYRIGGTKNPNVDGIVMLGPDLVIANEEENRREDLEELAARGVPVWITDIRTVDQALSSISRLLAVLGVYESRWLDLADAHWALPPPVRPGQPVRALVPIWRRPWMALGPDTYAGDVLARIGVTNILDTPDGDPADRYPRFTPGDLPPYDVVILPDEPYRFSAQDGPEAFPGMPCALVDGRALTWYGPAMVTAPEQLTAAIRAALPG